MAILSRWLAPAALAAGLGFGAMTLPAPAQAQDDLIRVLVDVADVVLRGGQPYYRHGNYGYDDRLIAGRDRYGRLVYYRTVPRSYANYNRYNGARDVDCNRNGKCKVTYYDPRYDRSNRYVRYGHYDRYGRRWDDRRRWDDDDDDRRRWNANWRDRDDDDDDD
jgi:hypothetical protein